MIDPSTKLPRIAHTSIVGFVSVDQQDGRIIAVLEDRTVECEVPRIFGEILSAEVRGDYIVAHTARGKASFHATSALAGKMPWHAMVKAFQDLCLVDSLAGRVQFHITHHRYKSGGKSRDGAAGRILIDGEIVYKGVGYPGPDEFEPRALGSALAAYLNLTPTSARESDDPMVRALALLDRRLSDAELFALDEASQSNPLWQAFHRLRSSQIVGKPG